jgi:hypothetical protein
MNDMIPALEKILGEYNLFLSESCFTTFKHVVSHLYSNAQFSDDAGETEDANHSINVLERYLLLLKEFPIFREQQIHHNLFPQGITPSVTCYVNQEYSRLMGKSPE